MQRWQYRGRPKGREWPLSEGSPRHIIHPAARKDLPAINSSRHNVKLFQGGKSAQTQRGRGHDEEYILRGRHLVLRADAWSDRGERRTSAESGSTATASSTAASSTAN